MVRRVRALAALCGTSALGLLVGFVGVGPAGTIAAISYWTYDPPAMPDGTTPHPLLGEHYFGDWPFFVAFGGEANPYLIYPLGLNGLPPSVWFFRGMHALPLGASLLLMMALAVGLTFTATWLLLDDLPTRWRVLGWFGCFGLSAGFLTSLDRGAMQAVAIGLVGLWLWALLRERPILAGLLMAAAVAFKPYLGLLLLWPMAHQQWRSVITTVAATVIASLAGFALLTGGMLASLRGYLHISSMYTSTRTGTLPIWANSLWRLDRDLSMMLPGAAWAFLVVWVLSRRRDAVALVLLLSCTQLALPLSQPYTAVWAGLGVVLLSRDPGAFRGRIEAPVVWLALAVTIIPIPVQQVVSGAPVASILSPCAWLLAGLVVGVHSIRSPRPPDRVELPTREVAVARPA